jgi:hypothetical protein
MGQLPTIQGVARLIAWGVRPLASYDPDSDAHVRDFVASLGWILDDIPQCVRDVVAAAGSLAESLISLEEKVAQRDTGETTNSQVVEAATLLFVDTLAFVAEVRGLPDRLSDELPPSYLSETNIDGEFADRFFDWVFIEGVSRASPRMRAVLVLLGLIEVIEEPADPLHHQPPFRRHRCYWNRFVQAFADPQGVLAAAYGWSTPEFRLWDLLQRALLFSYGTTNVGYIVYPDDAVSSSRVPGIPVPQDPPPAPELWYPLWEEEPVKVYLAFGVLPKMIAAEAQGVFSGIMIEGASDGTIDIAPGLQLTIEGALLAGTGILACLRPDDTARIVVSPGASASTFASGRAAVRMEYSRKPDSGALLRVSDDVWFDLGKIGLGVAVEGLSSGALDVAVELALEQCRVRVSPGEDGFLAALLPEGGIDANCDAELRWSSTRGLHMRGSADLTATIGTHLDLGVARLRAIRLGLNSEDEAIGVVAAMSVEVVVGQVKLVLDDLGIAASLEPGAGNFGRFNLEVDLRRPRAIEVGFDVGGVSGDGFLAYEESAGRYSGALALQVHDLAVHALAILDTHGLEGGYSLVGVITAEFEPIQLGLGITLNGVGGLIGINRRIDKQALEDALAGPRLANIFFPADPVAAAGRLLTDIGQYFPVQDGRHVFGPAAKLAWLGLVTADVAILIEVPAPIRAVILGHVHSALPSGSDALVTLNADILGTVEFEEKRLEVAAQLRDSQAAGFTLEGGMRLRVDWDEPPDFILSVGGFHSQYRKPADFRAPKRVKIPIGSGDDPRMDLTGFLALTSNTAQVGANVDFYASGSFGLSIEGQVEFEALFIFSPFSFRADFWGHVALKRNGGHIAGVSIDATITGPTPWRAWGEACLVLKWLPDICVGFDVTIPGTAAEASLTGRDPWPELQAAIADPRNWAGGVPPAGVRVIKAAPAVGAVEETLIDPLATATLRQNVVPLNRKIEKYGGGKTTGLGRYEVLSATVGGASVTVQPAKDWFAAYQFEDMTDDERLSRDAFERMDAGVTLASDDVTSGAATPTDATWRDLSYDTIILRQVWEREQLALPYMAPLGQQLSSLGLSAAASAPLRVAGRGKFAAPPGTPPRVSVDEETFVVVSVTDLGQRADITGATTHGGALAALEDYLGDHPNEVGTLQVVPLYELLEAA